MEYQFVKGQVGDIVAVLSLIPEFSHLTSEADIVARLAGKQSLILVATHNARPIGFKIGYSLNDTEFYSWLGGVIPAHRKMKVASQLRQQQEAWAIAHGFNVLKVKSMNQFPIMLQMLISSGYQICGYENNGTIDNSKIEFVKTL